MYPVSCGLHAQLKQRIVDNANNSAGLKEIFGIVAAEDLGTVFPQIVAYYKAQGTEEVQAYLDTIYDLDYSMIPPDPDLVKNMEEAKSLGLEIFIYTNSPAFHVVKVMEQLGFTAPLVDNDHIYDLFVSQKPTPEGFAAFVENAGFDPKEAAFADDGSDNLVSAKLIGTTTVLIAEGIPDIKGSKIDIKVNILSDFIGDLVTQRKQDIRTDYTSRQNSHPSP